VVNGFYTHGQEILSRIQRCLSVNL
jgi:hypothetical protein